MTGFDIALSGMDGAGKSSVAQALAEALRERCYTASVLTWRDHLRPGPRATGSSAAGAVYAAMIRSLYSACIGPDGGSAEHLLPGLGADLFGPPGTRPAFDDPSVPIALNPDRSDLFFAAGLMEVAARAVERATAIGPALARGEVVIQDSSGLRNCVKWGTFAQQSRDGDAAADRLAGEYLHLVRRCLAHWAPPAVNVLVVADPRLAYAWRIRQRGFIGRAEHSDVAGHPSERSFLRLQSAVQDSLVAIAEAEGWPRVTMRDQPRDRNVGEAVRTILAALADRGLLRVGTPR